MKQTTDFYKSYYVNQAKQKGGNLPAFHGARTQHGYGIGNWLKGLFRWAIPKVTTGAKALGRAAAKESVGLAQDVMNGEDFKKALANRAQKAGRSAYQDLTSQNPPQSGQQGKGRKRKAPAKPRQSQSAKKQKTSQQKFPLLK